MLKYCLFAIIYLSTKFKIAWKDLIGIVLKTLFTLSIFCYQKIVWNYETSVPEWFSKHSHWSISYVITFIWLTIFGQSLTLHTVWQQLAFQCKNYWVACWPNYIHQTKDIVVTQPTSHQFISSFNCRGLQTNL